MRVKKYLDVSKLTHNTAMLLVVGGVVVVGSIVLAVTHAATPTASISASAGTVSSCATKVTDSTTSSGSAVKFSGCSAVSPLGLDASGATIPDTNYPIPTGAIYMATNGNDANTGTSTSTPVLTLNRAIALVPSGGTIVVRAGTYRDWYNSGGTFGYISKPLTIQAYPHEQVWFDGTDVIPTTSWTSDGAGHWYMAWNTPSFCSNAYYTYSFMAQPTSNSGPCSHYDMYYSSTSQSTLTAAADPQMAFINGVAQHEVTSLAAATAGNFFYDWTAKRIYIGTNPSGATVELAARPVSMVITGAGSKILGVGFKRYASNEYNNNTEGALVISAASSTVENSAFVGNAGGALGIGNPTGAMVNHSVFANNGFDGLESNGHQHNTGAADGIVLQNSLFNNNNAEGFGYFCSASCSQAAVKFAHMVGFTAKNNIFQNTTNGHGFWCDLACTKGVMVNNYAANNGKSAIFYEVSDTGIIASNMSVNNSTGIRVASANTKIYNNTIINSNPKQNDVQLWVYDDDRSYNVNGWTDVGPDTQNVTVVNNVVELAAPNILFWASSTSSTPTNTWPDSTAVKFFSGIDYNSYWRPNYTSGAVGALYKWTDPGVSDKYWQSVSSFHTAYPNYDANSSDYTGSTDPFFTNAAGGDYSIRSGSTAYHSSTALPADVMQAIGVTTATGYSRGAITWPH